MVIRRLGAAPPGRDGAPERSGLRTPAPSRKHGRLLSLVLERALLAPSQRHLGRPEEYRWRRIPSGQRLALRFPAGDRHLLRPLGVREVSCQTMCRESSNSSKWTTQSTAQCYSRESLYINYKGEHCCRKTSSDFFSYCFDAFLFLALLASDSEQVERELIPRYLTIYLLDLASTSSGLRCDALFCFL